MRNTDWSPHPQKKAKTTLIKLVKCLQIKMKLLIINRDYLCTIKQILNNH